MPTLLKRKSSNSPGIISFTHNEALWGVPAKYPYVRELLNSKSKNGYGLGNTHVKNTKASKIEEETCDGYKSNDSSELSEEEYTYTNN